MEKKLTISLENYSKKFDKVLFSNTNLTLVGPRVCLLGANGSGKTTLMKELYIKHKDNIAYFEQSFQLFENATGEENIKLINKNLDYDLLRKLGINLIYQKK